jgi:hypothetical protein
MNSRLALFALVAAAAAGSATPADAVKVSASCSLDYAQAAPCTLSDSVGPNEVHTIDFVFGTIRVRFTGKTQTGWWSGTLNGKPAMGYELNRGHTLYVTTDLATRFEWWSQGHEHGTY